MPKISAKASAAKKPKAPVKPKKSDLTSSWKQAFEAGWMDNCYVPEEFLHDEEVAANMEEVVRVPLSKHQVGPYLIVPTMSDDSVASAHLLAVVGFKKTKTVDVNMGNPSCTTLVYEEDPRHEGPRGMLMIVQNERLSWLLMLT